MPDPDNEESPWGDHRITDSLTKDRPPELQEQRSLIRYLLFEHGGEMNSLRNQKKKMCYLSLTHIQGEYS